MGRGPCCYLSPFGLKAEGFLAYLPGVKTLAVTQRDPWATNDDEVIKVGLKQFSLNAHVASSFRTDPLPWNNFTKYTAIASR